MNNLRARAREIKDAGVAERGNFEPTGAPLRMYNYWLGETNSGKGRLIRSGARRENFCHFWRVVAIWAPLMWLRRKVEAVVGNVPFLIFLGVVLLVAVIAAGVTWTEFGMGLAYALLGSIGFTVAMFGIFAGVSMAMPNDEVRDDYDVLPGRIAKWGWFAQPTFIIAFLATKVARSGHGDKVLGGLILTVIGGFLIGIAVTEGILVMLAVIGTFLAAVVALALAALVLGFLFGIASDFINGRRRIRGRKAAKAANDYYLAHGEFPREVYKRPLLKRFFSAIGDLVVFVAQVVRVKKWKICPTVDINK